jgi:hypothetical protein
MQGDTPAEVRLDVELGPKVWACKDQLQHASTRGGLLCAMYPDTKGRADLEPLYSLTAEEVTAVNEWRARRLWQSRQMHLCKCDHHEYCQHCYPEIFRPSGVWHGLGA